MITQILLMVVLCPYLATAPLETNAAASTAPSGTASIAASAARSATSAAPNDAATRPSSDSTSKPAANSEPAEDRARVGGDRKPALPPRAGSLPQAPTRTAGRRRGKAVSARPTSATPAASPAGGETNQVPPEEPVHEILLADLDGDGRYEPVAVYGNRKGCHLAKVVRAADAVRLDPIALAGNAYVHGPALGDADGDGTVDLLSVGERRVLFRKGLGGAAFAREPRVLYEAPDLLLAEEGCRATPAYLSDVSGGERPDLVLPIPGGVRVLPLPATLHTDGDSMARDRHHGDMGGEPRAALGQPSVQANAIDAPANEAAEGAANHQEPRGASANPVAGASSARAPGGVIGGPTAGGVEAQETHGGTENPGPLAPNPDGPRALITGSGEDLLGQPSVSGAGYGLTFVSPLPTTIGSGRTRILVLGPVIEPHSPRLEFAWWRREDDGSLEGHRTSLALPPGESAALVMPFDLEGDGRPEIAVLTAPSRIKGFFGEFDLRVYRSTDRADSPASPFYLGKTDINYWQYPSMTFRPAPGGGDLLIAFYRGLIKSHLNVEVFRSNGSGSFLPKPREVGLESEKEAERNLLVWTDVNGDGLIDLVVSDEAGIRVLKGTADRDRPLDVASGWTCSVSPSASSASVSLSASGGWSVSYRPSRSIVFRDLDGDGLCEAIGVQKINVKGTRGEPGELGTIVTIKPLVPVAH